MKLITSCRGGWVRRAASQCLAALILASALGVLHAPPAATLADTPQHSVQTAQDLTFAALGIGDQTVHGQTGSIVTYFPAPGGPLASSGNLVRIFFAHSAPVDPGASLAVAINGHALASIALGAGTRAGGVFEKDIPAANLNQDRPNQLEVRFSLLTHGQPGSVGGLYGQLGSRTLLHYELKALDGGSPDALEDYPSSLVWPSAAATSGPAPVGVILPARPDAAEVAAAARLMADLGRRARSSRLEPHVVVEDPAGWLASASSPAIVIGRVDHLPSAGALLQRAGFTRASAGWHPPREPSPVQQDAGIVASTRTADAGGRPVLLVTGGTDQALARAAEAVIQGARGRLSGRFAIVGSDPEADPGSPVAGGSFRLSTLLGDNPSLQGAGEHRLVFALPTRAADQDAGAQLHLVFDSGPSLGDRPPVVVEVNGHTLQVARAAPGNRSTGSASVTAPGRFLHSGLNEVALVLRTADASTSSLDLAASSFVPPPAPRGDIGLAALPYPFLDADPGSSTTLVLTGLDAATLQATVAAFVSLGSRALASPPPTAVRLMFGSEKIADTTGNVVVLGSPPSTRRVGLRVDSAGELLISAPASRPGVGWLVCEGPVLGGLHLLWVGGDDAPAAARAALATGSASLQGHMLVVDRSGAVSTSAAGPDVAVVDPAMKTRLPRLLPIAATVLLLLLVLGSQAFSTRSREEHSSSSRAALLVVLAWCGLAIAAELLVAPNLTSVFFSAMVLVVGALSLRDPAWQGVVAAFVAAAALESVQTFISGSRILLTLGGDGGGAVNRITAMTSLRDIVPALLGMVLLLATPAVGAATRRRRRRVADGQGRLARM